MWVYPKCAFTDMESISSRSEHTKITFQREKNLQSDTNIDTL